MDNNNYIVKSLELHLFFGRIMKEHSLFLRAGFTPANANFSNKAEYFKKEFEKLLSDAVTLSEGIISHNLLCSGELVTEFTLPAEKTTEAFTGIGINKGITARELRLVRDCRQGSIGEGLRCKVQRLNRRALELLDGLIAFKELILRNVLCCQMFTMNYPLLIEHIIREAKLYREYVSMLERDGCLTDSAMRDTECFWNRIMMEHAMFIRGLLDPTEEDLINTADSFAKDYSNLLSACNSAQRRTLQTSSLDETLKFRDFKMAGTKGIEECKIRSVILPLLADHVLREANHYIRLLQCE
ncbi:MAG: DUF2935 domain-containing protein [Acutalibacteraceae bacterium]|nr:DUF2935 domain-containing protein [Acutalibacteraceae bacterium]